ncbi:HAD hydrolase, IA, variant 3 family protein [Burkholderia pseudomallei MSHR3965]|nr:HAD hydrolase, IA, variant 3 family protein [Burkholderia pseudomallei MSHR3965]KGS99321.1 HAD hydrolase, IA, variant 3 family protein [Burkholderia pseudomallei]KGV13549.1 HAD hydrolase, IA, variant 3 family protein [Burkholderia pseudomallei MSHR4300]KGW12044.1 HAD hydrolase, IA, variant 3 family protein [Burkholderia pseudomallei MSHR4000]
MLRTSGKIRCIDAPISCRLDAAVEQPPSILRGVCILSKILVFDIGGVVIFHDNASLLKRLASRMPRPPDEGELLAVIRQSGIGTGTSTLRDLQVSLTRAFSWKGTYAEFLSDWSSHFSPNTLMFETIRSVGATHPVILCSNTNQEHWATLCNRYEIQSICQSSVLSFEVGVEKPDKRIFEHVRNIYSNVRVDDFLLIDDNAKNVQSAKEFGFSSHHYTDHGKFLSDLKTWSLCNECSRNS